MDFEFKNKISEFLENTRYRIVDIAVKGGNNNKLVEVFIDGTEPVNIDELGKLNREIWEEFEKSGMGKDVAKMVVSSPGTDKPIVFFWQLKKHINRQIKFKKETEIVEGILKETEDFDGKDLIKIEIKKHIKGRKFISEMAEFEFKNVSEIYIIPGFKK